MRARSDSWQTRFGGAAGAGEGRILDSEPVRSRGGTRFRLFPQPPFLERYRNPVTVRVSSPAGSVGPGPADDRMYVVVPIGKRWPYGIVRTPYGTSVPYGPPWDGPIYPPAMPDARGHFDHIPIGTRAFEAAHAYAAVRWVLDVWEWYLERPVKWHFRRRYTALEISLLPEFDVGTAGYGFLEVGSDFQSGEPRSFALNFDVIAHEVGHLIIYSLLGLPDPDRETAEYQGFHESAADVVALIAAARFEPVIDELFEISRGNLYVLNELNRFAELSQSTQIRLASNTIRMSEFSAGWSDEHYLSLPLTGAIFDILVDVFHELLVARRLISPDLEDLADRFQRVPEGEDLVQAGFDRAYAADPAAFREAFVDACDVMGRYLAAGWQRLRSDLFTYADVGAALLGVDAELSGGRYRRLILVNFQWREIGQVRVGPWLAPGTAASHLRSVRTMPAQTEAVAPRLSYRERFLLARGGVHIAGRRAVNGVRPYFDSLGKKRPCWHGR